MSLSKASTVTKWVGIRGLDAALPFALLSGTIVLCWTLPAAIGPVEPLRYLGDAQIVMERVLKHRLARTFGYVNSLVLR